MVFSTKVYKPDKMFALLTRYIAALQSSRIDGFLLLSARSCHVTRAFHVHNPLSEHLRPLDL